MTLEELYENSWLIWKVVSQYVFHPNRFNNEIPFEELFQMVLFQIIKRWTYKYFNPELWLRSSYIWMISWQAAQQVLEDYRKNPRIESLGIYNIGFEDNNSEKITESLEKVREIFQKYNHKWLKYLDWLYKIYADKDYMKDANSIVKVNKINNNDRERRRHMERNRIGLKNAFQLANEWFKKDYGVDIKDVIDLNFEDPNISVRKVINDDKHW